MAWQLGDAIPLSRAGTLFKETAGNLINLFINDVTPSLSSVYSASRTEQRITEAVAAALEGEDLSDLAAQVTANASADAGFVSFAGSQTLTEPQKAQFRTNIGAEAVGGGASHDAVTTSGSATTNPISVNGSQVLSFNIEGLTTAP